jgi:uncharacterized membrane protein (UPF0136 family)
MRVALLIALILFFGWFAVDALASLFGQPLEGVHYPMASGRLKSMPHDWTAKAAFWAPLYLVIFAAIWFFFVRREGPRKGLRLASLATAFVMVPFWVVSLVSADLHGLEVNGWWAASMAYANITFGLYGFIGDGDPAQLNF